MHQGDRYQLPPPRKAPGIDWRRLARWSLLGAFIMFGWLLYPTARCSLQAAKDTEIGVVTEDEYVPEGSGAGSAGTGSGAGPGDDASRSDAERVDQGLGFFERWGGRVKECYAQTPITGQESWKESLFFLFAAGTVIFWILGRATAPNRGAVG
jgi:hypothetical protein